MCGNVEGLLLSSCLGAWCLSFDNTATVPAIICFIMVITICGTRLFSNWLLLVNSSLLHNRKTVLNK